MFRTTDHVYRCKVPGYEDTDLVIGLKVMPPKEFDALSIEYRGLTPEGISSLTIDKICEKVAFIEGYETENGEITDPKELYAKGVPGVWSFIQKAVMNEHLLSANEIKN